MYVSIAPPFRNAHDITYSPNYTIYQLTSCFFLQSLLDSRVKPWVNKKISEYIGEEEPTLTDFICQKVMTKSSAQSILTDVAMVSLQVSYAKARLNELI